MEYSVHAPHQFIVRHSHQLLPGWSSPVMSVLVVLQKSEIALLQTAIETEIQKNQLRDRFIEFGRKLCLKLNEMGYLAEVFDPRTGLPLISPSGAFRLDDVAVVRTLLGYPTCDRSGCRVLVHPIWGSAVYPSVLLSSAEPELVEVAAESIAAEYSWYI